MTNETVQRNSAISAFEVSSNKKISAFERRTNLLAQLKTCTNLRDLEKGRSIHNVAIQSGDDSKIYVANTLVNMYAKCESMEEARSIFENMKQHNVVSWNTIILGYAANGDGSTALDLFSSMRNKDCAPNERTFLAALKACIELARHGKTGCSKRGKQLHLLALENGCLDIFVGSSLLDMYVKCGNMEDAYQVFQHMTFPDVVCWTALILGYADNGNSSMALNLFFRMRSEGCAPNTYTFVAAFRACTELALNEVENGKARLKEKGKALHLLASCSGCDSNVFVKSILVDMYANCLSMADARRIFDSMEQPDVACWNALILGYVDNGEGEVALNVFSRMESEGYAPDTRTFVAALKACGIVGALEFGRKVHADIRSQCLEENTFVANSLVDFYAKCGSLVDAEQVFNSHATKDYFTWTALMTGYSRHGDAGGVFRIFDSMQSSGLVPDPVTFTCMLTACSYAGLVDDGKNYFELMSTKYGIAPDIDHYTCMVDMFGRANKFENAMELLRDMSLNPDYVTWMALLGACSKWKKRRLGKLAFESLKCLKDKHSGAESLMASLYEKSDHV